jgi:hypothetical protein
MREKEGAEAFSREPPDAPLRSVMQLYKGSAARTSGRVGTLANRTDSWIGRVSLYTYGVG